MFNLADVCRALTLVNPARTKQRLAERGIATTDTPTLNQFGAMVMQPMTYIDEANLYSGIFQSYKAEAEKYQDWVFEVVLRNHVDEEDRTLNESFTVNGTHPVLTDESGRYALILSSQPPSLSQDSAQLCPSDLPTRIDVTKH